MNVRGSYSAISLPDIAQQVGMATWHAISWHHFLVKSCWTNSSEFIHDVRNQFSSLGRILSLKIRSIEVCLGSQRRGRGEDTCTQQKNSSNQLKYPSLSPSPNYKHFKHNSIICLWIALRTHFNQKKTWNEILPLSNTPITLISWTKSQAYIDKWSTSHYHNSNKG